jgi:hypothetical protein
VDAEGDGLMLLFAEGFDNYTGANVWASGTGWLPGNNTSATYLTTSATGGVLDEGRLIVTTTNSPLTNHSSGIARLFPQGTVSEFWCCGWFRRHVELPGVATAGTILGVCSAAGAFIGSFSLNTSNRVFVTALNVSTPLVSSSAIATGTSTALWDGGWHFVEIAVKYANPGYAKVWIDRALDIDFAGNTVSSGSNLVGGMGFAPAQSSGSPRGYSWDDFIVWEDTDTGDGFAGAMDGARLIKTLRPSSDAAVQFTPSSGTTNYSLVNEQVLATAGYVQSGTSGHVDRYGVSASGLSGVTVKNVVVTGNVGNPGGGTINAKMIAERSGATAESVALAVPGGAAPRQGCFPQKPGGGVWTIADVDAATYGIKVP